MLAIDPDECIDCAVCVPECPVNESHGQARLARPPRRNRSGAAAQATAPAVAEEP
jgi:ferredoxin